MGVFTGTPGRWRVAVAGLAAGVVVGGTVAVVAPAVATQDTSYAATNWKKVWKNNLQQYADKRYYTKKKAKKDVRQGWVEHLKKRVRREVRRGRDRATPRPSPTRSTCPTRA